MAAGLGQAAPHRLDVPIQPMQVIENHSASTLVTGVLPFVSQRRAVIQLITLHAGVISSAAETVQFIKILKGQTAAAAASAAATQKITETIALNAAALNSDLYFAAFALNSRNEPLNNKLEPGERILRVVSGTATDLVNLTTRMDVRETDQ